MEGALDAIGLHIQHMVLVAIVIMPELTMKTNAEPNAESPLRDGEQKFIFIVFIFILLYFVKHKNHCRANELMYYSQVPCSKGMVESEWESVGCL